MNAKRKSFLEFFGSANYPKAFEDIDVGTPLGKGVVCAGCHTDISQDSQFCNRRRCLICYGCNFQGSKCCNPT